MDNFQQPRQWGFLRYPRRKNSYLFLKTPCILDIIFSCMILSYSMLSLIIFFFCKVNNVIQHSINWWKSQVMSNSAYLMRYQTTYIIRIHITILLPKSEGKWWLDLILYRKHCTPYCVLVFNKYQPSSEGGARSPSATPHRLQNPKLPPGGPKMAEGVWKCVYL